VPIYRGYFKILFTRNSDYNVIYRGKNLKDGKEEAATVEGKVTIITFYLQIPVMEYNSESQNSLIKELLENRYIFQLKKWECIPIMNVSGTSLYKDITMLYKETTNPVWAFVVFQTTRSKNQQMYNGQFDYIIVKNLWFDIGGKRYPEDPWELDFDNGRYALAYDAFLHFQRRFFKTDPPYMATIPYVDKNNFRSTYPIYSIDLTNQPESISNAKSKITLHVDFNKPVSPPGGANELSAISL